ncbi:MAG: family 20 glycosylhydrolase [Lentisphaerae bacterium]|nr:family 20 glycosylhydrolase [Lentisphaerota bacterium]
MKNIFFAFLLCSTVSLPLYGRDLVAETAYWLVPTPQEFQASGQEVVFEQPQFQLDDQFGLPAPSRDWLLEELAGKAGWSPAAAGVEPTCVLSLQTAAAGPNSEAYHLTIAAGRITLSAAELPGMLRAVGRLLCIMHTPLLQFSPGGRTTLPELSISDYPDAPFRGTFFQIGGDVTAVRNTKIYLELAMMAELGYNHAIFEVGGRIECRRHPEINRKPGWTDDEIRAFIAFAKARGITIIPATNSIGHFRSAPRIFPLAGERERDGKKVWDEELAMDLSHPRFWEVYLDYLDELTELFGNQKYLCVGTDEFHHAALLLEEKLGRPGEEFYPEFLNKVCAAMRKKGIEIAAWHDMMVDRKEPRFRNARSYPLGAINGFPNVVEKLDPDINIMYWNYGLPPGGKYVDLNDLHSRGAKKIWVTTFRTPAAAQALFAAGRSIGVTHFLGSIWSFRSHQAGFPSTAEFAWNSRAPQRSDEHFGAFNDNFFYARSSRLPQATKPVAWDTAPPPPPPDCAEVLKKRFPEQTLSTFGLTFDLSAPYVFAHPGATPPPEIPLPWDFAALTTEKFIFQPEKSFEWSIPEAVYVDQERLNNGIYVYTPAFGPETKTNIWGQEIALVGDTVQQISGSLSHSVAYEMGSMAIPPNGYVFSCRALFPRKSRQAGDLRCAVQVGQRIILRRIPASPPPKSVTLKLSGEKQNVSLLITTLYPFFREQKQVGLVLKFKDGSCSRSSLAGRDFLSSRTPEAPWRRWVVQPADGEGRNAVLAVEWQRPADSTQVPLELTVTATPAAIQSALSILAAAEY